ncbi:MAG TPA: TetR/AcrR family transcriptional regulator [Bryobacteraceae bacterium]|nr:TetR/AcrR family transcriptional regulator [Bryobacteraceae bacterium]
MGRVKTVSDAKLLEVARRAFVKEGFSASTKAIARRAGVSEGVLFQRFTTKQDLFFAAMIPPPADLNEIFHHPAASGFDLFAQVTLSMLEYFRTTLPVFIPLMSYPAFRFEEFAQRHPDSPMVTLRRRLVDFMSAQQQAGAIGPVNPGAAALVAWSIAHCIAFFEQLGAHGGRFDESIIRATLECAWNGLSPAPSPKSRAPKLRPTQPLRPKNPSA